MVLHEKACLRNLLTYWTCDLSAIALFLGENAREPQQVVKAEDFLSLRICTLWLLDVQAKFDRQEIDEHDYWKTVRQILIGKTHAQVDRRMGKADNDFSTCKITKEEYVTISKTYLECYTPKPPRYRGKMALASRTGMAKENRKPVAEAIDACPPAARVDRQRACKIVSTAMKREAQRGASPSAKSARLEEGEQTKKSQRRTGKSSTDSGQAPVSKCSRCAQAWDTVQEHRPLPDSVDECVMLTSPKLAIEVGSNDMSAFHADVPLHKVTCFSVFDDHGHLCPFNTGLLEKGQLLYFSGYVKPIVDEDPSAEGGVAAQMGPIDEWYTAGFDGGKGILGFATGCAEYILMEPADDYASFMVAINEQLFYSQLVLSFLSAHPGATYDDLLNEVKTATKPDQTPAEEDRMLYHAPFIVEQVNSYDAAADKDEQLLACGPCITRLAKVAGCVVEKTVEERQRRRFSRRRKAVCSLATTTLLVESVIGSLFRDQIDTNHRSNRTKPCGQCLGCTGIDCGKCDGCKGKVKTRRKSKKTLCTGKRCTRQDEVLESSEDSENSNYEEASAQPVPATARDLRRSKTVCTTWLGTPLSSNSDRAYYSHVCIGKEEVYVGDAVLTSEGDLAIVRYMWETAGKRLFHAQHLCKASSTILSEVANPKELFLVDECSTYQLNDITKKIKLVFKKAPSTWNMLGGNDDRTFVDSADDEFFYHKHYELKSSRFEDISMQNDSPGNDFCLGCQAKRVRQEGNAPVLLGEPVKKGDVLCYSAVRFKGHEYSVGGCCYLDPELSYRLGQPLPKKKTSVCQQQVNHKIYTEAYRKTTYVKGSYHGCQEPFRIARIKEIFRRADENASSKMIYLKVVPFYRPEDTCTESRDEDLNLVFASMEERTVDIDALSGVCAVKFLQNPSQMERMQYFLSGHDRFYFSQMYNPKTQSFEIVPEDHPRPSGIDVTDELLNSHAFCDIKLGTQAATQKLRTLDVFAGCGGLSEGLRQSEAVEPQWAIESNKFAAASYALNHPSSTVFVDDCNLLLRNAMEGNYENKAGQKLPRKGEVDFLCGGPPCQGFSGLNRFSSGLYARLKNSLIASFLSYCDFYRPRFFLLENVRNFVSYNRSIVLKLTLQCLLRMGYQCTFGVLQAGCYGVPQSRPRVFIFAAAPGEKLPSFPEPLHVFSRKLVQISTAIDGKRCMPNISRLSSAPFRQITVRDAISDLPDVTSGASAKWQSYKSPPVTHFQRLMRDGSITVSSQVCREMHALMSARVCRIPKEPGSDWRDLPNVAITLDDGRVTELLRYTFRDSTGSMRGVCPCAEGGSCDEAFRQDTTLIPWCLPHTAQRHNQWAGLYGRLDWDGYFSTTVTCPEPMGKQGRVLHPNQDRIVTVREMARSQGFADSFQFTGDLVEQYCQVGNAVPPPLARELGHEIRKCLLWKTSYAKGKRTNC